MASVSKPICTLLLFTQRRLILNIAKARVPMSTHRIIFAALKLIRVGLILFATATIGFGQAGNRPVLIFTGIANPESFDNPANEYRAAILIFDRKVWRLIYFPQQYENAGWMYSGRSKNKPEAWGIA